MINPTTHQLGFGGALYGLLICLSLQLDSTGPQQMWLAHGFAFAYLLRLPHALVIPQITLMASIAWLTLFWVNQDATWSLLFCLLDFSLLLSALAAVKLIPRFLQQAGSVFHVLGILFVHLLILLPLFTFLLYQFQPIQHSPLADGWFAWWSSYALGVICIFVPVYSLNINWIRRSFRGVQLARLLIAIPVCVLLTSALLYFFETPYIYISFIFSFLAVQYGLTFTAIAVPIALVLSHYALLIDPAYTPLWMVQSSIKSLIASSSMTFFMAQMTALTMRMTREKHQQLEQMQNRFSLACDSIGMGVWDWDLAPDKLFWDPSLYELYDIDPNDGPVTYEKWKACVHPDDVARTEKELKRLASGKGRYRSEFRIYRRDGELRWITAAAVVLLDKHNRPERVVGLNWDCTERKQAELNFQEMQTRLQAVIDAAEEFSIITTKPDGTILVFSRGAEKMLGYTADEMVGKQNPSIFHDVNEVIERGKALSDEFGETIEGFEIFVHKTKQGLKDANKWTYIHKDGHRFPVRLTVSTVFDAQKNIIGYLGVAQDISLEIRSNEIIRETLEQVNQEAQKVEESRQQLEAIFKTAPEPLIVVNEQGEITQANYQAHRLFKYQDNQLLGKQVEDLVPDAAKEKHHHLRSGFFKHPKTRVMGQGMSLQGKCSDGQMISVDINLAPYYVKEVMHIIVTVHDMTEQNRIKELLTDAAAKATAMSRAKSEFVASMSHEIRTPMNAVLASSQLLKNTDLDVKQDRYVNMIHSAGNALLGILNDILDFSKIEAGKFELQNQSFDLDELCESLASIMSSNAANKGIEFIVGLHPNVPKQVIGDGPRLQQVLINLIGNAIKFTEQGQVVLAVDLINQENQQAKIRFSVKDSGIGIEPRFKENLFAAFSQEDGSNTRKYGGTGLGLTISQRLVNLMNGEIQVDSELGVGSDFHFELTLPIDDQVARAYPTISDTVFHVVDGNEKNRFYIGQYLNAWGCEYQVYSDISQVNLVVEKQNCLLMDTAITDNLETVLSGLPDSVKSLTFLMQSNSQELPLSHELKHSIAGTIHKPILISTLYDSLVKVLAPEQVSVADTPHAQQHPLKGLNILLVEDNSLNQVVATEILNDLGASVSIADNGQMAFDTMTDKPHEFDCILMDVQMPVMDGFTATRKIREELKLGLPILAMTAGVMEKERQSCIDAGMDDFIAKPIDIEKLLMTIQANVIKP